MAQDFHNSQLSQHCRVCGSSFGSGDTTYSVADHIASLQAAFQLLVRRSSGIPMFHITQEVDEYLLPPCTPISAEDIECAVCLRILERPLQLPCGQLCCTPCLCAWVTHTPTPDPLSCPCCQVTHTIHESQLLPPPQVLQKLLDTLRVRCRRCLKIVTAGAHHHLEHLESSCRLHVLADEPVQETSPLRQLLSASSSPQQEVLTIHG
jgi:hypothetical protein